MANKKITKSNVLIMGFLLQMLSVMINNIGTLCLKLALKENSYFASIRAMNVISSLIIAIIVWRYSNQIFKSKNKIFHIFIITLLNIIANIALFKATEITHPVYISLFGRSYIIMNIFFSVLILKEKMNIKEIPLICLVGFSMYLFSQNESANNFSYTSLTLILTYCLCFSLSFVFTQKWSNKTNYVGLVLLPKLLTSVAISLTCYMLFFEKFHWTTESYSALSNFTLLLFAATPIAASMILFFKSTQLITFRLASVLRSSSPVIMYLLSIFIFPLNLSKTNIIGGFMFVVSTALLMSVSKSKAQKVSKRKK